MIDDGCEYYSYIFYIFLFKTPYNTKNDKKLQFYLYLTQQLNICGRYFYFIILRVLHELTLYREIVQRRNTYLSLLDKCRHKLGVGLKDVKDLLLLVRSRGVLEGLEELLKDLALDLLRLRLPTDGSNWWLTGNIIGSTGHHASWPTTCTSHVDLLPWVSEEKIVQYFRK